MVSSEIAGSAADTAADVEYIGTFCELGAGEEEVDELGLGALFGIGGVYEIAVVDVLAPGGTSLRTFSLSG